jgi:hypothetical protein
LTADRRGIGLKRNLKDNMLVHQPNENDQVIITDDLLERNRTKGVTENGQSKDFLRKLMRTIIITDIPWIADSFSGGMDPTILASMTAKG